MSIRATAVLAGFEKFNRELKLSVPRTKAAVVAAIHKNTEAVAGKAKATAPRVSGDMASTVRTEYQQEGLVGRVKVGEGKLPRRSSAKTAKGQARAKTRKRTTGKGAYAPVVERGDPRRHHKAHPFLIPAFGGQVETAKKDINGALNGVLEQIP